MPARCGYKAHNVPHDMHEFKDFTLTQANAHGAFVIEEHQTLVCSKDSCRKQFTTIKNRMTTLFIS